MMKDTLAIVALAASAAMLFTLLAMPAAKPELRSVCTWVTGCRIA